MKDNLIQTSMFMNLKNKDDFKNDFQKNKSYEIQKRAKLNIWLSDKFSVKKKGNISKKILVLVYFLSLLMTTWLLLLKN